MNDLTFRTLRHIKTDNRMRSLIRKRRYINPKLYNELKRQKICDYCYENIVDEIHEIHHIIAIKDGGTNMRNNLMVLHKKCHKIIEDKK